jgi:hypothetical protein
MRRARSGRSATGSLSGRATTNPCGRGREALDAAHAPRVPGKNSRSPDLTRPLPRTILRRVTGHVDKTAPTTAGREEVIDSFCRLCGRRRPRRESRVPARRRVRATPDRPCPTPAVQSCANAASSRMIAAPAEATRLPNQR